MKKNKKSIKKKKKIVKKVLKKKKVVKKTIKKKNRIFKEHSLLAIRTHNLPVLFYIINNMLCQLIINIQKQYYV